MTADQTKTFGLAGPESKAAYDRLIKTIQRHGSALVAYSGGVDSTLLAAAAAAGLGDKTLLVTAASPLHPESERREAERIAQDHLHRPLRVIHTHEMEDPAFRANPADRCYHCKLALFTALTAMARDQGYEAVFEGTNADDLNDYRPGRRALDELGIVSPLLEAGLTKKDIRDLSAAMGLPTAAKPSNACLATRFPYNEQLTIEKLLRVDRAENALRAMGFGQLRVRSHGDLARLEFVPAELERAWRLRDELLAVVGNSGFTYATLDLKGFRSGAMDESLPQKRP